MKKAFTMVELIFVIVIIGIMAAIAIPKLTVTRDDAKISTMISNAKVILADLSTYYTARGNREWKTSLANTVSSVSLEIVCGTLISGTEKISPNTFVLCNDDVICLSFSTTNDGNLTIENGIDTTSIICEAVKNDPAIEPLSNKTYNLGGSTVVR